MHTPYPTLHDRLRGLYAAPLLTGDVEADKLVYVVADGRAAGVEVIAKALGLTEMLEDVADFDELVEVEEVLCEIGFDRGLTEERHG